MDKVGFIGTGNMGSALIKGILKSDNFADNLEIYAYDKDSEKLGSFAEIGVNLCTSSNEVVKKCKYIVLAIKPQFFDIVLEEIKDSINSETVLISIAAGISDEYIQSKTVDDVRVVLVMPNTPMLLGEGACAISKSVTTSIGEYNFVKELFSSCGIVSDVSIDKMKEIIAINGSSPAFIFLFAKYFVEYGKSVGISEETATKLFSQSLIGSAKMITDSGFNIDELIKMVSSPGGTTLAGLEQLYKGDLSGTVEKACKSCTKRAYELSK